MIDLQVLGAAALADLSRRIRAAEQNKTLARELRRDVRQAVRPLPAAIEREIPATMPSGYAPVLSSSWGVRTQVTATGVSLTGQAKGRRVGRDVRALNRGSLRAPSWPRGRRAGWRWHVQRIRSGFWSRPVDRALDDVRRAAAQAIHRVARRIAGGS